MPNKKIKMPDYIVVDEYLMDRALTFYHQWRELDSAISAISTRGVNFPGELSEIFACYALEYEWKKGGHGDAYDRKNDRIIEIKGSGSKNRDLSSFSPTEKFDELIFVKVDKKNDKALIYETGINSTTLKTIMVNKTQTLGDQQADSRRPRFSIEKKIIAVLGLKPSYELNIGSKTCKEL